jgi:hypothetical protein
VPYRDTQEVMFHRWPGCYEDFVATNLLEAMMIRYWDHPIRTEGEPDEWNEIVDHFIGIQNQILGFQSTNHHCGPHMMPTPFVELIRASQLLHQTGIGD